MPPLSRLLTLALAAPLIFLTAACDGGGEDSLTLADLDPQLMTVVSFEGEREVVTEPAAIAEAMPYEILLPTEVPDGFVLGAVEAHTPSEQFEQPERSPSARVFMSFGMEDGERERGFTIEQYPRPVGIGDDAPQQPIEVDGHEGVLIGPVGPNEDVISISWYVEPCDRTVMVSGHADDEDMLLQVAESMQDECA